jgi:predicted nucleotidyltransferase
MNPYRDILRAMNETGIRYVVVGGVAVNLHGYRRFTADMDILLALDDNNLEAMTELMHKMGYVERLPVALQSLCDPDYVKRLLKEKGMTAYTFLSNARERIDIDVLAAASLNFEEFDGRKIVIDIDEGVSVPVIAIDDLIAMKKEANREKDVLDIKELLELKSL